jgi:DNA-binding transcriptional regulator GbsR (MarR family)
MKLTTQQMALLTRAMTKLEGADLEIQRALPADELCYDLHERIEEILAEIEMLLNESEEVVYE